MRTLSKRIIVIVVHLLGWWGFLYGPNASSLLWTLSFFAGFVGMVLLLPGDDTTDGTSVGGTVIFGSLVLSALFWPFEFGRLDVGDGPMIEMAPELRLVVPLVLVTVYLGYQGWTMRD